MADEDLNAGQHISVGILFGDIKGSTAEAEADEEGTVAKLREYERVVNRTVQQFSPSHYKVRYEGDGFMAVFDTAKSMVECGVAIRDEFRKRGWLVRLGGHFGEGYRNDDGDILGADVNRAARIQSGADAGEFFVSATVRHIVRNKSREVAFRAHPPLSAKGIPEPLEVFEVISPGEAKEPRPAKPPRSAIVPPPEKRRWSGAAVAGAAFGVAVLAVAGSMMATAFYQHLGLRLDKPQADPPAAEIIDANDSGDARVAADTAEVAEEAAGVGKNVVAVLTFENQREDDEHSWFSKALQTTLTTELNGVEQLKVVSLERIQRIAEREDIDRMEAARRLGVHRFVAGSFAVYGDDMRIDAWVVETANGLQSAANSVEGTQKEFFKLQKDIARATLEHFHFQVAEATETEVKTAKKSSVDKYRQLLGAEGVIGAGSVRVRKKEPSARSGVVSRRLAAVVEWCHGRLVTVTYAESTPYASTSEVMQFLEAYRSAHESGDIERLAALYQSLPESQRASVRAYMSNIEDLKVELSDVDIDIGEQEVTVSYTRVDSFTDIETGEGLALEVRLTKFLVRQDGALKFAQEAE